MIHIVTLHNKQDRNQVVDYISTIGGNVIHTLTNLRSFLLVELNDSQANSLKDHACVKSVIKNYFVEKASQNRSLFKAPYPYNWGLDRISTRKALMTGKFVAERTGEGIVSYVIDDGILKTHDEIISKVYDDSFDPFRANDISGISNDPMQGWPDDTFVSPTISHGTAIAGLIAGQNVGVAPLVKLVSVKIFSSMGEMSEHSASMAMLVSAVDWIITHNTNIGLPGIVNMSFVFKDGRFIGSDANITEYLDQWNQLLYELVDNNLRVVVAAGNNSVDAYRDLPASAGVRRDYISVGSDYRVDTVIDPINGIEVKPICVGSTTKSLQNISSSTVINAIDQISEFSNYGDIIDLFAPGEELSCPVVKYDEYTLAVDYNNTQTYENLTGTSFAAAIVTGISCLYLEAEPNITQPELRQRLIERATKGIFSNEGIAHYRESYEFTGRTLINPYTYSPNNIAYVWGQDTTLSADFDLGICPDPNSISLSYELNEESSGTYDFRVKSTSALNETLKVTYRLHPNFSLPSFVTLSDNYESDDSVACRITISSTSVNTDEEYIFVVQVTDGVIWSDATFDDIDRATSCIKIKITIKNVPKSPVWISPDAGQVPLGTKIKTNDILNLDFIANDPDNPMADLSYQIAPGPTSLPNGLYWSPNGNISGTVGVLPKNKLKYPFVIRAVTSDGMFSDRTFYFDVNEAGIDLTQEFDPNWLNTLGNDIIGSTIIYRISTVVRGNSWDQELVILNPDHDPLTYTVIPVPETIPNGSFNGFLPIGMKINKQGHLTGVPSATNQLTDYYFGITLSDPQGNESTSYFVLKVIASSIQPIVEGNLDWITPEGSLGSVHEGYPVHFYVEAKNTTGLSLSYSIVSGTLPEGVTFDSNTGQFSGLASYVDGASTFTFQIKAQAGTRSIIGTFYFNVIEYVLSNFGSFLYGSVSGYDRLAIEEWVWLTTAIPDENLFKLGDENFARVKFPRMYLVGGIDSGADELQEFMTDYHKPTNLQFGKLKWALVKDPSGKYIYDVVYFELIDPQVRAGGFNFGDNIEEDVIYPYENILNTKSFPTGIDPNTGKSTYYPNTIRNMRLDLLEKGLGTLRSERDYVNGIGVSPKIDGPGLTGTIEPLPYWMTTPQSENPLTAPGWNPAIVVAYVKAGKGLSTVTALNLLGINSMQKLKLSIDRWVLVSIGNKETIFDDGLNYQYRPVTYIDNFLQVADQAARDNLSTTGYEPYQFGVRLTSDNTEWVWSGSTWESPSKVISVAYNGLTYVADTTPMKRGTFVLYPNQGFTGGVETTFDNGETIFDYISSEEGKYLKFEMK